MNNNSLEAYKFLVVLNVESMLNRIVSLIWFQILSSSFHPAMIGGSFLFPICIHEQFSLLFCFGFQETCLYFEFDFTVRYYPPLCLIW